MTLRGDDKKRFQELLEKPREQRDEAETYWLLAAPFDREYQDTRGGTRITYVTGEQVVSRLNLVLGTQNWSFHVMKDQLNAEADEVVVLGEISATLCGGLVTHQQYGSQKVKRSRSTGAPLDIGFDFKGATTDCIKKCATYLGVGLYLSNKEAAKLAEQAEREAARGGSGQTTRSAPKAAGTPQAAGAHHAEQQSQERQAPARRPAAPSQPRAASAPSESDAEAAEGNVVRIGDRRQTAAAPNGQTVAANEDRVITGANDAAWMLLMQLREEAAQRKIDPGQPPRLPIKMSALTKIGRALRAKLDDGVPASS